MAAVFPKRGVPITRWGGPHWVMGIMWPIRDHVELQQRTVDAPIMDSGDLHAVTVRLDLLRDILIELAAALPPDRAACVAIAIGNRLTQRLGNLEIAEPSDDAMISDLAPLFEALSRPCPQQKAY